MANCCWLPFNFSHLIGEEIVRTQVIRDQDIVPHSCRKGADVFRIRIMEELPDPDPHGGCRIGSRKQIQGFN